MITCSAALEVFKEYPVDHGEMSCGQKSIKLVWRYYQLLYGFLVKGHLPRVSRQSRLSANDRVMLRWYLALYTDLVALTLQLRKTRKSSIKRPSISRFKWGPSFQMRRYQCTACQEGSRKEQRKEGKGGIVTRSCLLSMEPWAAAKKL